MSRFLSAIPLPYTPGEPPNSCRGRGISGSLYVSDKILFDAVFHRSLFVSNKLFNRSTQNISKAIFGEHCERLAELSEDLE